MEVAQGGVVSSTDGKIENYEQKGKTSVVCVGDAERFWAAFSAAMAQKLICCRFQLDTTLVLSSSRPLAHLSASPLRDSFSILFMALQVQVNMCDKRPHEAQCEVELLFWPSC